MRLSQEFLSKYRYRESTPMTPLGEFVYYRTYSRFLPDKGRREYWWETCRRAVEYNCSIVDTTEEEAEKLFDNMYNLKQFLAGRTLWVGDTKSAKKFPMSNFNCSFLKIDNIKSYCDMFYLLMLGSGVGFRTFKEDVDKLPKFRKNITLTHKPYNPIKKEDRQENTTYNENRYFAELVVGDSKEGWVDALRIFLEIFSLDAKKRYKQLIINYNNVRPRGERLKTFGGTASGHQSLMLMLNKIYQLFRSKKTDDFKLTTLDCLDIANMLAENVVSGGVRRSSQINLSEIEDKSIRDAKTNLFTQDEFGNWILDEKLSHRMKSNNSIGFKKRPTREELDDIFKSIRYSGEPGFVNIEEAQRRFPSFVGTNPCGEILLPNNGLCNLVTVNVYGFVEDGKLNKKELLEAFELNARAAYRMTCLTLELEHWDRVQKEHRLIGCSMTGWQDAMSVLNYDMKQQSDLLKEIKDTVKYAAKEYSIMLGTKEAKLATTIKPEGTLSLLPTVSPGVHHSYSPYYIRRVRISSDDPLLKVCECLGLTVLNEVGQDDKTCNTKVVEFYVKSPTDKTRNDVSAIEQLETYKMFMENYVEHNASNTITVKKNEWKQVVDWVYDNWDCIVGVTFLSIDDNYYPLMPYESITEDEYKAGYKDITITPELISKYENVQVEELEIGSDDECSGGSCPIR